MRPSFLSWKKGCDQVGCNICITFDSVIFDVGLLATLISTYNKLGDSLPPPNFSKLSYSYKYFAGLGDRVT